jgi:hypothetical protein
MPAVRPKNLTTLGWCAAALVVTTVTGTLLAMTPALDPDHQWGILAAEQHLRGRSASVRQVVVADPAHLDRDRIQNVSWSAPGHQEAVYALRKTGLSLGAALKTLILAAWLVGIAGWAVYFVLALEDKRLAPWLLAAFALFRMSHYHGFMYLGGDMLLWAAVPLAAVATLQALRARMRAVGLGLALLAGVLTSSLIVIKYSAVFLTLGAALFWAWTVWTHRTTIVKALAWVTGAGLGAMLTLAAGVGQAAAGSTPASAGCPNPVVPVVVWSGGGWLMGLTDMAAIVDSFLRRSALGSETEYTVAAATAALSLLFIAWLILSRRPIVTDVTRASSTPGYARRLAVATTVVVAAGLFVLMLRGGCVSLEGRHQQYGAFLLMPLLADAFSSEARRGKRSVRVLTFVCAAVFFGAPTIYGASALGDKLLVRMPRLRSAVGPDGVRIDGVAGPDGLTAFYREVKAQPDFTGALLVTRTLEMPILFSDARVLILPGDDVDLPWRQRERPLIDLSGRPGGAVALLLSRRVEKEEGPAIRKAFRDVQEWKRTALASTPNMTLWLGR